MISIEKNNLSFNKGFFSLAHFFYGIMAIYKTFFQYSASFHTPSLKAKSKGYIWLLESNKKRKKDAKKKDFYMCWIPSKKYKRKIKYN